MHLRRPCALLLVLGLTASAAQAAPFAYVANGLSNTVSVLDSATNAVVATVPVTEPNAVALNPTGTRAYVTQPGQVSVIDTATNTVVATVPTHSPEGVAVNPSGTRVYVANRYSSLVSVIDTATNTVTATVPVGPLPIDVAINPAGTRVYVTNAYPTNRVVTVIDTACNDVVATVPMGTSPWGVAINPAGTRAYVAQYDSVGVLDTATNTVIATVPVGPNAIDVAVNPAGTLAYVVNNAPGFDSVSVLDTASNTITATVAVGSRPVGVAVNPAGTRVYVTNSFADTSPYSGTVSVIDTATNIVIDTVALGNLPVGLAFASGITGPPPPGGGPDNIRVTGMEVTQGIQDLANTVRLISGRRTFVRVYAQSDGPAVPGVTAALSGAGSFCTIGGCVTSQLGSLVPVNTVGPRITIGPMPRRSNVDESFLFELPWRWTQFEALRLHAVLTADPGPPAPSCPNDVLTAPLHEFQIPTSLKIQFVRLQYQLPGTFNGLTNQLVVTSLADQRRSESVIRRTYPVTNLLSAPDLNVFDALLGGFVARTAFPCPLRPADSQNKCAHDYITSRLAALQASSGPLGLLPGPPGSGFIGDADGAYALIPQVPNDPMSLYFTRGACCDNRVGAGPASSSDYAAHEIGHLLGRGHPDQGAAECGHDGNDPAYPYFLSFIGPGLLGPVASTTPNTDLAGFDAGRIASVEADGSAVTNIPWGHVYGQNAYDTMGYCKPSWVSDYTYRALHVGLLALHPDIGGTFAAGPRSVMAGGAALPAPQLGDWLMVFGTITPNPATAELMQTQRVDRIVSVPPRTPGDHSIRLTGAGGVPLADYPFTPEAVGEGGLSFGHVVPFVAGTTEIQIVDAGSGVIGTKTVSANAPIVGDVALVGAPDPITGALTVGWTASDLDGDPLTFDVFLMRDGGDGSVSLQPLMLGVSSTSVQIDPADLGGGSARFRVVATDGVQSAFADSPPFVLTDKPPRPRILTPEDGITIHSGQLLNLEGEATDPQDGVITGAGLAWSADGEPLDSGAQLSLVDLPLGVNRIDLTATNSRGLMATASVTVTVEAALDQPGPALTAGPTRIGWNVGVGASQVQTADLAVGNSGSGILQFTAESSAAWLTVSATAGTAPATLSLTADPVGIAAGATEEATVTLSAVGIPSQVMTIPVTLSVGNTFTRIQPSAITSTTSTTTTTAPTTTLPPCTTLRCVLDAARQGANCGDETIPAKIAKKLDLAITRAELAPGQPAKKAKRLYKSASRLLAKAGKIAAKAARGRRPTLSTECATDLVNAIREGGGAVGSTP